MMAVLVAYPIIVHHILRVAGATPGSPNLGTKLQPFEVAPPVARLNNVGSIIDPCKY